MIQSHKNIDPISGICGLSKFEILAQCCQDNELTLTARLCAQWSAQILGTEINIKCYNIK